MKAAEQADKMDAIFAHQSEFYSGVIVTATVPYKDQEGLILAELYRSVYDKDAPESVVSLSNSVGVSRMGFNIQTSIGQYKMVEAQGMLPLNGSGSIHVDFDFTPSSEEGIEFKWDVNTKPTMKSPQKGQFKSICDILDSYTSEDKNQPWFGIFER